MPECWLRTNRRAWAVALAFPIVLMLTALAFGLMSIRDGVYPWRIYLAVTLAALAILLLIPIVRGMRLPRLGFEDGSLLVYLVGNKPIRVPIEIVEVFFLGQGPAMVKAKRGENAETSNIVVRLAESATDWHHREVNSALGQWCEGYIVIRGTWCEPIDTELLKSLNARLVDVHRKRRQTSGREK